MSLQDKIKNAEETMWPMTMGMSIGEAISKLRYELNNNNKMVSAYAVAIETMRKYQKIEELYDYWRSGKCEYTISCMENIGKVLRDGNDDN